METYYELILQKDTQTYLLSYCNRKSSESIFSSLCSRAAAVIKITGCGEFTRAKDRTWVSENGWTARYSGRTQRDAKIEGQLTYVGHV